MKTSSSLFPAVAKLGTEAVPLELFTAAAFTQVSNGAVELIPDIARIPPTMSCGSGPTVHLKEAGSPLARNLYQMSRFTLLVEFAT